VHDPVRACPINKVTTGSRAAAAIREQIRSGMLRPGIQLRAAPFAISAGVSKSIVHEAIQVLVREGRVH